METSCIACDGPMAVVFRKHAFDILRCSACGLGRTAVGTDFDPASYYSEAYFQGGRSDSYSDYISSEPILREEFRRTVRHLVRLGCRRGRLLEFGCAYGFLLDEAKPHFEVVHGIDISSDAVTFCRARGLDAVAGVADASTMRGPYDVVIGLDVIEHLSRPHDTLREIASQMTAGGLLLMTTGDWASMLGRMMGRHWRLMTPPQHLSFFTERSMRAMLDSAGFTIREYTHPWKHVPVALMAYQLQRMMGLTPRNMSWLKDLALPVNLGDAMRVVAVRR